MSITPERRRALLSKLEASLGPDETITLMEMIDPGRWSDVATKADLERLATRDDLHRLVMTFITWMLAGQATLVAMVGILVLFAV